MENTNSCCRTFPITVGQFILFIYKCLHNNFFMKQDINYNCFLYSLYFLYISFFLSFSWFILKTSNQRGWWPWSLSYNKETAERCRQLEDQINMETVHAFKMIKFGIKNLHGKGMNIQYHTITQSWSISSIISRA